MKTVNMPHKKLFKKSKFFKKTPQHICSSEYETRAFAMFAILPSRFAVNNEVLFSTLAEIEDIQRDKSKS